MGIPEKGFIHKDKRQVCKMAAKTKSERSKMERRYKAVTVPFFIRLSANGLSPCICFSQIFATN